MSPKKALEPSDLSADDPWMLAEDIPNIDFFFSQIWLQSFVNDLEKSCGRNYAKILGVFCGPDMKFYYGKSDCHAMAKHLVRKIKAEPSFGDAINANILRFSDELQAHARTIPSDVSKLSNDALCDLIETHVRIHTRLYEWGWLSNATDMFYPEYTDYLKAYLRKFASSEEEVNAWFITLSAPDSFSAEALQHQELLGLAIDLQNDEKSRHLFASGDKRKIKSGLSPVFVSRIEAYAKKYEPIGALWMGKPFSSDHYLEELSSLFTSEKSPAEQFEAAQDDLAAKTAAKEELFQKLGIDEKHRHLFLIFSGFMISKFYRRYAQLRALYALRPVFAEISKRFGLSGLAARLLLTQEYRPLLVDGTFDLSCLKEREKLLVLYSEKGVNRIFAGNVGLELAKSAEEKIDTSARQLSGQCACLGKAQGKAKIILSAADMPKMNQGDILVAIATNPDVVPAMKKAGAIVTEQGGVTCHAAIVSRELNIPCVIGTKIATRWLKDGDWVEVDAGRGIVRKL